jgi:nitroimidazol reductase NimA-like FMN-containing flavoprotein (pyridoxamine 5'-phosphate oxidase superfamily)
VNEQAYAVLCVQGGGQPYGALVAFAFSEDLRYAVFATPVTTRKYRLLSECDHVALVIDNRPDKAAELMEVEAVTATGRSQLIARGREFDQMAELLISRHPYLKSFVRAQTCAMFRVEIVRFLHVSRFQEVRQWIPTAHS